MELRLPLLVSYRRELRPENARVYGHRGWLQTGTVLHWKERIRQWQAEERPIVRHMNLLIKQPPVYSISRRGVCLISRQIPAYRVVLDESDKGVENCTGVFHSIFVGRRGRM